MQHSRFILILVFLAASVTPAIAQMEGPPREGRARERLEELRRLKMIEALKLDEEQAVRLTVRERKFREEEKERFDQRKSMLEDLQKLIENGADDEALKSAIDRLNTLSTTIVEKRHEYLLSLGDFLSMEQIARLVLFEHRFAEEVRHILRNAHERGRRK